jgi:hypothetical protein
MLVEHAADTLIMATIIIVIIMISGNGFVERALGRDVPYILDLYSDQRPFEGSFRGMKQSRSE